jgi:tetratricopeptide (TPR) repeat protein
MGDWDGAIADATKAIELEPGLANAWDNRSNARNRKHDWDEAITDSTKAIELDPGLSTAWGNRGSAREQKGDLDGAVADFRRFLELEPRGELAETIRRRIFSIKVSRGH